MPSAQPPVPVVPTQARPLPQRPLALQVEPSAHASMRDQEVIDAADEHGVAMVFTGVRHFRH